MNVIRKFVVFLLGMWLSGVAYGSCLPNCPTTYTYVGPTFDLVGGSGYTTSMSITGSFFTASPLPANMPPTDIGPIGSNLVTGWSFTDGIFTYTKANSIPDRNAFGNFQVQTNALGNVSGFYIQLGGPPPPNLVNDLMHSITMISGSQSQALKNDRCNTVVATVCTNVDSAPDYGDTNSGGAFTPNFTSPPPGNLKSELVWRNKVDGRDQVWFMNGLLPTFADLPTVADTNWEIKGVGDFDGDGKPDVLWRNKVTGHNVVWLMNGYAILVSAAVPTIADLSWEIKGVGDFNGDGKADVIWRNKVNGQNIVWLMNGSIISANAALPTIADTNWEIKGVGDFDGDGKADVLWRNKVSGQNIGWLMNGLAISANAFLATIADTNWEIKGVGDFDGDGKADVIWRNKVSGQNIGWLMNGLTISANAFLATIADMNWEIKGVDDLDGDGKADVLWRNKVSGNNIGWLMNGLTISKSALIAFAPIDWEFVGP